MKTTLLSFIVTSFLFMSLTIDMVDDVASAIRSGNPKNISKYFIESIDLKVMDQEDVYSKQQAEMILKDFFTKHPVKSFNIAHRSTPKNASQYIIGTLETTNGKFRVYFLNKTSSAETLIQQFRIENENEQ